MDDDYDDDVELFNDDFDDGGDTVLQTGVRKHVCPDCKIPLDYRVEGRFVVRYCSECPYEEED